MITKIVSARKIDETVSSDAYLNNSEDYEIRSEAMKAMGVDCTYTPVGIYGEIVLTDKEGKGNLDETQQNIRERFNFD